MSAYIQSGEENYKTGLQLGKETFYNTESALPSRRFTNMTVGGKKADPGGGGMFNLFFEDLLLRRGQKPCFKGHAY